MSILKTLFFVLAQISASRAFKVFVLSLYVFCLLYLGWELRESRLFLVYVVIFGVTVYWVARQAQVKTLALKAPSQISTKETWKKVYSIVKPMRKQNQTWKVVIAFLQSNHPDLPSDEKTLRKILWAGDNGFLD